jgi:hypothetical protein
LTLDFLYKHWLAAAGKEGEIQNGAGVSTIDDLFLLRNEFGVQVRSREELVKRLSNVQNLVSTSANPAFQRDIKIPNIQSLIG